VKITIEEDEWWPVFVPDPECEGYDETYEIDKVTFERIKKAKEEFDWSQDFLRGLYKDD